MNDMRNKEPQVFWKMFKKKAPDTSCQARNQPKIMGGAQSQFSDLFFR